MPAIVSGTVLRWTVDWNRVPPTVSFHSMKRVSVYASDGAETEAPALIGQYIIENPGHEPELLHAARDGLLQVVAIDRLGVTPPEPPPRAAA
jgi:hypothetical protein